MAIGTAKVAKKFTDVQTGVAVNCDFPLFAQDEIIVKYGLQGLTAVLDADYTVALDSPDYETFTVTPTAALLTKINNLIAADPDEVNQIVVIRELDYLTTITQQTTFFRNVLAREFDRVAMKFQQLAQKFKSALLLPSQEVDVNGNPSVDMTIPTIAERANKLLGFDATGKPRVSNLDLEAIEAPVEEAQAAADTATAQAVIATTKAAEAAASEAAAEAAQAAAEAARKQAQAYAQAFGFDPVTTVTAADSPLTLGQGDNGTFFVFDPSAGAIVVNWPEIDPTLEPYKIGYRIANVTNPVTFTPAAGDTINGAANFVHTEVGEGIMSANDEASSDDWLHIRLSKPGANTVGITEAKNEMKVYDIPFVVGYDADGNSESVEVKSLLPTVLARNVTFEEMVGKAVTAPTGAAMIFDIELNGVSIYGTKPQIAAGATVMTAGVLSTTQGVAGDRVQAKITQVGSTVAGAGVVFAQKARVR